MAHISKHHSKEKGKCDDTEDCWIGFFISWDAISIHNLLINRSYIIRLNKRWPRYLMILIRTHSRSPKNRQTVLYPSLIVNRCPKISNK